MKAALLLVAFAGLSRLSADPSTVAEPPAAPAPVTSAPVVFDANAYVADCTALADDYRQLQQLEQEIGRP